MTGLSCYTANLAAYLRRLRPDADEYVARSIRLAVDPEHEPLAFSHHAWPLNALPGGRALGYRAGPDPDTAIEGLTAELAATGAVLVVVNAAELPWSPAGVEPAPHYVLVDDRAAGHWRVVDEFRALTAAGLAHEPFAGSVADAVLRRMIRPVEPLRPEHRMRNAMAFGAPVPVPPPGSYQWLATGSSPAAPLPATLVTGTAAFDVLADRLADTIGVTGDDRLLDDVWAAAQHHVFRHTLLGGPGSDAAIEAWRGLPRTLRFAADSARRGRPRASLVATAMAQLRVAETATTAITEVRTR